MTGGRFCPPAPQWRVLWQFPSQSLRALRVYRHREWSDIVTKNLKAFYLVSAILGAVVPYYCFWRFLRSEGIGVMPLIEDALINGAAAGFTLDVVISSLVFWAFMLSQKEKGPAPLRFIVLNLFVGLSWALPAYLWAAQSRSAQG